MSTIFNSTTTSSGGYVSWADMIIQTNKCVKKSQLTTSGTANGVVQLSSASGITANSITSVNGGLSVVATGATVSHFGVKRTVGTLSEITFVNTVNTITGAIGNDITATGGTRGTFLWSNGVDKIQTGAGATGVVNLISTNSGTGIQFTGNVGPITQSSGSSITQSGAASITSGTGGMISTGDIVLARHLLSNGTQTPPSISTVVSGNCNLSAPSRDTVGVITVNITAGSAAAASAMCTLQFGVVYNGAPTVIITPMNQNTTAQSFWVTVTSSSFTIWTNSTANINSYIWNYMVIGY